MSQLKKKPLFNPLGDTDVLDRRMIGGNTTNLNDFNNMKYEWVSDWYRQAMNNFWIPEEINLGVDIKDYRKLPAPERRAYDKILSFLIFLDSLQSANLPAVGEYITANEVNLCLAIQTFQETVHSQSYSYMLDTICEPQERNDVLYQWKEDEQLLARNEFIGNLYNQFQDDKSPEALARVEVNPLTGIDKAKAVEIARAANFPEDLVEKVSDVFVKLFDVYKGEDATLVEVNPLVRTEEGDIIALDGKVTLDDNASEIRHPEHEALEDKDAADPLEAKAKESGLNYVKLDGEVGIIGNGAGLVMSTLDVVAYAGENHNGVKPANFLDIGGGASAEVMANGLDVILNDEQVKAVFVNVFGGITACDEVARGIVGALKTLGDEATKPLVVRIDGNNVEEGRRILAEANHPLVTIEETMDGGARKAAELAAAAK